MFNSSASLTIQQVFSKQCLVNLISKGTHLVFSMYVYMSPNNISKSGPEEMANTNSVILSGNLLRPIVIDPLASLP